MALAEREQYNAFAAQYTKMAALPLMQLEAELIRKAIGSLPPGKGRVLDLGGGAAAHARTALKAGAEVVDVVDISEAMMKMGELTEQEEGRQGKINFLLGDVTQSLDHLGLKEESYDLVMANWVFDHAMSVEDLDGMWKNVAKYAKPGGEGRFVGVRVADILSPAALDGKYGVVLENIREIPGGRSYVVVSNIEPPLSFEGTSMEISSSGSLEMHHKYGFGDVMIDYGRSGSEVVNKNTEFWDDFLKHPYMAVVSAVKK